MIRDNADNNPDAFLLIVDIFRLSRYRVFSFRSSMHRFIPFVTYDYIRNDKKKRMKKERKNTEKNEKKRCIDENISLCYQGVGRKKKFS